MLLELYSKEQRKSIHRSSGSENLPTQETRIEKPCCRKPKTVTYWCYRFSSVGDHCTLFWETHYGCEGGREYKWSDGCFGFFESYRSSVYKCFKEPLDDLGSCREGYSKPVGGQWPPSYNPTRRAALVAGGSSTVLAGLIMVASRALALSEPIENWPRNLPACTVLPIILGITAIIASVFAFRQIGRIGRGGVIGGLLAIVTAILLYVSSHLCVPFTLEILIELTFLIVGGILSLIGE